MPSGKSLGKRADTAASTRKRATAPSAPKSAMPDPGQRAYQCRPQRATMTPATASAMPGGDARQRVADRQPDVRRRAANSKVSIWNVENVVSAPQNPVPAAGASSGSARCARRAG